MRKKGICVLAGVSLLAVTVSGCGGKGDTPEGGGSGGGKTLKILTHYDAAFAEAAKKYEEETGVKVEVEQTAYENIGDTLEVVLSSGSDEYDLIMADGPNTSAYVNRGYLEPLSGYFTEEEKGEFSPELLKQGTVGEEFYAAPLGDSSTVLYYNKNLLSEAGIEVDWSQYTGENRITWEELTELARKAVKELDPDGSKGIYGIEIGQVSSVYQMNLLANSMGGKNISDDGSTVKGVIDSDEWKDAIIWYQGLVEEGIFSKGVSGLETYNNFYAGKCVFEWMTADSYTFCLSADMTEDDFGWTYQPCFAGHEDEVATGCGNWALGVSAFSKNKEEAGKFVNYMTYGEGNDIFLSIEGMSPNTAERYTEELTGKNPVLEIAKYEAENTACVRAVTPAFNEYSAALSTMWEDIRNGADIDTALERTVEQIDSALGEYSESQ